VDVSFPGTKLPSNICSHKLSSPTTVALLGRRPTRYFICTRAFQFAIRIDSIRYANRFKSIRFVKNRPFDSLVVMQIFFANLVYSLSQK